MTKMRTAALGGLFGLCVLAMQAMAPKTDDGPVLFAEGVISVPGALGVTFSPDGRTAYFGRFDGAQKRWVILQSRSENGEWMPASPVEFSSEHHDAGPALSPDGKQLLFWSLRPSGDGAPKESRLWVVERAGNGWGEPRDLGAPVNVPGHPSANASVSAAGTIYFVTKREDALGGDDIYRSRRAGTRGYEAIENVGASINSPHHEFNVYVAPDESYVLFASNRPGGYGKTDLYISSRTNEGWAPPRNLGVHINSPETELAPSVSADGRYLFFSRVGGPKPGIYRISAASAGIGK